MPSAIPWTITDLQNAKRIKGTGARSITIDGELTVFRDDEAFDRLIAEMERDVAAAQTGVAVAPNRAFVTTWHMRRGLGGGGGNSGPWLWGYGR